MNTAISILLFCMLLLQASATPGISGSKQVRPLDSDSDSETAPLLPSGKSSSSAVAHGMEFIGCAARRQKEIETAAVAANEMILDAHAYLYSPIPQSHPRYKTWFGNYDGERRNQALSRFGSMRKTATSMTYDCQACKKPTKIQDSQLHGYISRSEGKYKINLCPKFWEAPVKGQAAQLVKELSRMVVGGGKAPIYVATDEVSARSLAISNPEQAVMNVVNLMHFARNNPALS